MRMTDEQKFVLLELHEAYLTYLDRRELAQEVRVIFIIWAAFSQQLFSKFGNNHKNSTWTTCLIILCYAIRSQ